MKRRGLSPVIATVLLISLTLVVGTIIVIWARSFIGDVAQKNGEPVENSCSLISFDAEIISSDGDYEVKIVNRGDVPIYGINIKREGDFSSEVLNDEPIVPENIGTLRAGQTGTFAADDVNAEDSGIVVVPVILSKSGDATQYFACENAYEIAEVI